MTANTTDAHLDQEPFPFMRLPPELRLMVYQLALRDITDPIVFPPSTRARRPHPRRGALALLYTSKHVRLESHGAMWYIADRHSTAIGNARKVIAERILERKDFPRMEMAAVLKMYNDHAKVAGQSFCIDLVTYAIKHAKYDIFVAH